MPSSSDWDISRDLGIHRVIERACQFGDAGTGCLVHQCAAIERARYGRRGHAGHSGNVGHLKAPARRGAAGFAGRCSRAAGVVVNGHPDNCKSPLRHHWQIRCHGTRGLQRQTTAGDADVQQCARKRISAIRLRLVPVGNLHSNAPQSGPPHCALAMRQ